MFLKFGYSISKKMKKRKNPRIYRCNDGDLTQTADLLRLKM